ncbi:P-loop NTPase fold protein [Microbacterium sorbitolivorans]|uniref:P-loop NTPase fold protein n=1 Tax=Microbacterium sorbitolivorans TaxID=1867410 RepID=UPI0013B06381|nr:P-loop NTPase fold protein [Microbacterium sorbitolivorans]
MTGSIYLFDDNPATQDLTGLSAVAVAVAVADVAVDDRFETLTVGLNSPWGGGKSTALNLIEAELRRRDDVVVIVIDPWEFVDSGDPRGTLINRVLEGIAAELSAERLAERQSGSAKLAGVASDLVDKLNEFRKRVSWSKVAQVAITSAVTLTPNIAELVNALTPEPAAAPAAKGMRDFRADFGTLLAGMGDGSAARIGDILTCPTDLVPVRVANSRRGCCSL